MLRRRRNEVRFVVERLEVRAVLSASSLELISAVPAAHVLPAVTNTSPVGFNPTQIRHAYGFDHIAFSNGAVKGDGSGQTIAIVDAYGDPNILADLQTFDRSFGLNDPKFTKVNQSGGTRYPSTDAGWALETALDVEWAHAVAPGANILLVEANTASLKNLLAAVDYARKQTGVVAVSMSWGSSEFSGEGTYNSYFTTPSGHGGVTFVASSGDSGSPGLWPAFSSNVLSVGGTALTLADSTGTYSGETGWSGSGGGKSLYEAEPTYQAGVQTSGRRSSPDVAYDAAPGTGFAVYDSITYSNQSGWFQVGGTSAGAPQWAALIAIADQGRALAGLGSLSAVQANVYSLPAADFHDVTVGSNGGFSAGAGYDMVSGFGSPYANLVVQGLLSSSLASQAATSGGGGGGGRNGSPAAAADIDGDTDLDAAVAVGGSAGGNGGAAAVAAIVASYGNATPALVAARPASLALLGAQASAADADGSGDAASASADADGASLATVDVSVRPLQRLAKAARR
jgi:subtilase family serine protease